MAANQWAFKEITKRSDILSKRQFLRLRDYFYSKNILVQFGSMKELVDTGVSKGDLKSKLTNFLISQMKYNRLKRPSEMFPLSS